MSSTEFTVGLGDGSRISSKVLKPPGGGSSDIFGLGNSCNVPSKPNSENISNQSSTGSRLFGGSDPSPASTKNTIVQSSVLENVHKVPSIPTKKVYVRHNPITGEETEICLESENGDKNDCDNKEVKGDETEYIPSKPVQTSIRVRNPPGGKSSGIF